MVLPSSAQHRQPVPLLSVHLVALDSTATSRDVSESCSGISDPPNLSARGNLTLPNRFTPTFPHTPVSPNSGPCISTPNSQSSTSRVQLPRLDMEYLQSTLGRPPITPDSPLRPSDFQKSTAHGQDQMVHGQPSPSTPLYFSPGRADLPSFSRDQSDTSTIPHYISNGTVLFEGDENRKRGFTSDLSGMLPTPISPHTNGSPVTPVQAIDLTEWISRSYGLDPIAGGAFGNVWKCTYDDGTRCIAVAVKGFRFKVNKQTSKVRQSIDDLHRSVITCCRD
ncbi:uncharacterized protein EDB91DRAFT_53551 [Suillus paluster]|uniref:uncharacterized protein n=1 Tax=Suillus paluster TaxID=48578 RepID=UPI001B85F718|nr:uncharacterized protein EDB91DRAFT_53551 [Suillus paluster]KAG1748007.1 hypothetical protein EDB91DRAFT_53551 [Suillus paluster]